jgi:predicted nucleic acid-binding protein
MYLLDANIFIRARNVAYPFAVFPGFWAWLREQAEDGVIGTIEAVKFEITRIPGNPLTDWANETPNLDLQPTEDAVGVMRDVSTWTMAHDGYLEAAKMTFLGSADYLLVAHAAATGAIVVTEEQPSPDSKKRVLIPDVCDAFDVAYIDTTELLLRLGPVFSIGTPGD